MSRPSWDNQFRETQWEKNKRLRAKRTQAGTATIEDQLRERIAQLETDLHAIKYEVMGGEDVPGSANAATVDDVKKEIERLRSIERAARVLADRMHRSE